MDPPEVDIAAVTIEDPPKIVSYEARRIDQTRPLRTRTYVLTDDDLKAHCQVIKSSSLTPQCVGVVRSFVNTLAITYPDTGRVVRATGLLDVELHGKPAAPGESGTAVYDTNGNLIGMVVAGSGKAYNPDEKQSQGNGRPVVYVQPLHDLLESRGWRIF